MVSYIVSKYVQLYIIRKKFGTTGMFCCLFFDSSFHEIVIIYLLLMSVLVLVLMYVYVVVYIVICILAVSILEIKGNHLANVCMYWVVS